MKFEILGDSENINTIVDAEGVVYIALTEKFLKRIQDIEDVANAAYNLAESIANDNQGYDS